MSRNPKKDCKKEIPLKRIIQFDSNLELCREFLSQFQIGPFFKKVAKIGDFGQNSSTDQIEKFLAENNKKNWLSLAKSKIFKGTKMALKSTKFPRNSVKYSAKVWQETNPTSPHFKHPP